MRKIKSLYQRDWDGDKSLVTRNMEPECMWVISDKNNVIASRKYDGTSCLVLDGELWKRYDAKAGKTPPPSFRPALNDFPQCLFCSSATDAKNENASWIEVIAAMGDGVNYSTKCSRCGGPKTYYVTPDPVTKHWPGWVPVTKDDPSSKWHFAAWLDVIAEDGYDSLQDGTYELCGPHFQGNPERLDHDMFIRHGEDIIPFCPWRYDELHFMFRTEWNNIEGVVWTNTDGRMCKIKVKDFGLERQYGE